MVCTWLSRLVCGHNAGSSQAIYIRWFALCKRGRLNATGNGARLVQGYPPAFGELLDYARQLSFDEPIDYERLHVAFEKLRNSDVEHNVSPGKTI